MITTLSGVLWYKRVLGAHFPAEFGSWQPAWGVEWERESFLCSSNRKDTVWAGKLSIPLGDGACSWFHADNTELFSSLGTDNFCFIYYGLALPICQTAQSSGRISKKTNPAWTLVHICCWEVVSSSFSLLKKKKIILTSPRSQASTFPSPLIQELSGEVAPVSKNKSYKSDSSCNTSYCPSNITAPGCWAGCGIELDLVLLLFSLKLSSLKQLCVFAGVFANVCAAKTPIWLC